MAIQNEPTRIQIPFADSGTKNVIPDTNSTPSASQAASWTDGFPAQCSLPLSAGGIPPARADFNGIFNTMTQSIRYGQEGGIWAWAATVDYAANRLVLGSDGKLYWSVAQSGPNVGGAQDPTTDSSHTYWQTVDIASLDADIQGKVDLDGGNASSIGGTLSAYMAHAAMPSATYATLTVPADGGATSPMAADGWVFFHARVQNNATLAIVLVNQTNDSSSSAADNVAGHEIDCFIPVAKGDVIKTFYDENNIYEKVLRFHYCNGSV